MNTVINKMPSSMIRILPEIDEAIKNRQPVVALESSIIAHGMPYPINIETALNCEQIIREKKAFPATVAVLKGKLCIGLRVDEIEQLGQKKASVFKLSRKDLAIAMAGGLSGATTVSTTMMAAAICQINIFSTGGIGGVHRGGENSLDISADLEELGRSRVAVVCAGMKSILDIGRTMEILETKGVPVIGFQTRRMPAFFASSSDYYTDCLANNAEEIAHILNVHWRLNHAGVAIIANPVPAHDAMDSALVEVLVADAINEAEQKGIRHKELTPFLLSTIAEKSGRQSLRANTSLVKNNARLAAEIAHELTIVHAQEQE